MCDDSQRSDKLYEVTGLNHVHSTHQSQDKKFSDEAKYEWRRKDLLSSRY